MLLRDLRIELKIKHLQAKCQSCKLACESNIKLTPSFISLTKNFNLENRCDASVVLTFFQNLIQNFKIQKLGRMKAVLSLKTKNASQQRHVLQSCYRFTCIVVSTDLFVLYRKFSNHKEIPRVKPRSHSRSQRSCTDA